MKTNLPQPPLSGSMNVPESLGSRLPQLLLRGSLILFGLILLYALGGRLIGMASGSLPADTNVQAQRIGAVVLLVALALGGPLIWRYGRLLRRPAVVALLDRLRPWHVVALALALRLAWVYAADVKQVSDFAIYDNMGWSISQGQYLFDPTFVRPSGCSIFFALIFRLFGHNLMAVETALSIVGAINVLLLYRLARILTGNHAMAILAALLLAISPEGILFASLLGTDVLFTFLITLALWLLARSATASQTTVAALLAVAAAGFVLGLGQYVRSTMPLFVAASLLWLLLVRGSLQRKLARLAILGTTFLLTISPIVAHNRQELGIWSVTLQQLSGWSRLVGSNLESRGAWNKADELLVRARLDSEPAPDDELHPVLRRDRAARQLAHQRWQENPSNLLQMIATDKVFTLWGQAAFLSVVTDNTRPALLPAAPAIKAAGHLYYMAVACAAGWALVLLGLARSTPFSALAVFVWSALLSTLAHMILETQSRYHYTFLPLLCLAAAAFLVLAMNRNRAEPKAAPDARG